jgi:hypothetical protein
MYVTELTNPLASRTLELTDLTNFPDQNQGARKLYVGESAKSLSVFALPYLGDFF